jgi:23S rRNA A1618 N6-methylase RlmF
MKNYITKINKEIFCPNFPNTNGFIKNMDDFLNEHTNENKQFN